MDLSIGAVAKRSGLTERTLRYYEEVGLLAPARDSGGRRRYDADTLARLYRVRLLRRLGTPVGQLDPDSEDLVALAGKHLADIDERLVQLARERERVRAVEDRLLSGDPLSDEALVDLLAGLGDDPTTPTRRITLLVYRDIGAAHQWLVDVFGAAPGELEERDGEVRHGELHVGDGVLWLHPESPELGLLSPATSGSASACLAVAVDDVDDHHARSVAAGATIVYPPADMPYGLREYGAHDLEGHLWSFQRALG